MDRIWLARKLEEGASYEAIARECGKSASTVSYWAKKHGLVSHHQARHAARGPLDRDALVEFIAAGHSIRGMAAATGRSPAAVRHWLKQHGLETTAALRLAAGARARAEGLDEPELPCPVHGAVRHVRRDDGFRCSRCRSEQVAARRRRVKEQLVLDAGGECSLCGYDRCLGALQFHHVDPATKAFQISAQGVTRSLESARAEAEKCVLLCANCHAEVERGVADLPVRSPGASFPGSPPDDPG